MPDYISFDHDLGDDYWTGYQFAKQIGEMVMDNKVTLPENFSYFVHSANPVGSANIRAYMDNIIKEFGGN